MADRGTVISLRINGVDWTHWKSVSITRQVDALAGAFSVSVADPWSGRGVTALPIAPGMECEVRIGDTPVITGYVGKSAPFFGASDHGITLQGRDRSADLADCAAIHTPGEWANISALQLAKTLAAPFGVKVSSSGDLGAPLPKVKLEQGESAADALVRALKMRELLACPDGSGGIVLARIGARESSTVLAQGVNIKSGNASYDADSRYSHYVVKGQQPGSDLVFGEAAAAVTSLVRDPVISRYRPHMVRAEDSVDAASARRRAEWEKTTRAAKSVSIEVEMQGFCQDSGELWDVNLLVPGRIPFLGLDQRFLIAACEFSQDPAGGSVTRLTLKAPDAYKPEPQKKAESSGNDNSAYMIESEDLLAASVARAKAGHAEIAEGAA